MHDVITHRVTLMVLQAGALQVSTNDDAVRQQADELRRSGLMDLRMPGARDAELWPAEVADGPTG